MLLPIPGKKEGGGMPARLRRGTPDGKGKHRMPLGSSRENNRGSARLQQRKLRSCG